tara:strand:- start:9946 stop:10794 length:849 start_codon:yes stop_codon:yes gene_type:complete
MINPSLDEKLQDYANKNKIKLCILTPCFGDNCYTGYVSSLLKTVNTLNSLKIEHIIEFCRNDSLVTRARNNLIARAMSDPDITHFMFIDNDIQWGAEEIIKLLCHDKNVIGGVYPIKKYKWDKILQKDSITGEYNSISKIQQRKNKSELTNAISDDNYIMHNLVDYNLNYLDKQIHVKNNTIKVKHIATGFMLIKRHVIESMIKAFPSTKYTDDVNFLTSDENKYAYALFDCSVENSTYCSEDWVFCNRWRNMGGNIFFDVTISLTHTGLEDYKGLYMSSIL